jgi:uncharacterized protein YjbJ (UPF0337 family)
MRTTRAYIASAGTAAVMLGASLCMLVLVSAFVAFGSWPGEGSGTQVDQVLLNEVSSGAKAKPVSVRTDAVKVARRSEARRQVAVAKRLRGPGSRGRSTGGANQVAKTPTRGTGPTTGAGTPVAAAPNAANPVNSVRQQTENVSQTLDTTTKTVTNQVQTQVDQTTTQVNQVVDQVVGDVQQQASPTVQQVESTVTNTSGTVKDAAGSLLGH